MDLMGSNVQLRQYDLEDRCLNYAQNVKHLVLSLPKSLDNVEYGKQLLRSAGSVGANYLEANEALGKKDFVMRIRISKKESKESRYWLQLLTIPTDLQQKQAQLIQESTELMKIFYAIAEKSK